LKSGKEKWCAGCHDDDRIVVDNPAASFVCSWSTSTAYPDQSYGDDVRYIAANGAGDCTATWVPEIPSGKGGDYTVYARWTSNAARATSVPYTIVYNGGTDTVWVDQTQNGGTWYALGAYDFAEGTSGSVMVSDNATGGNWVIADAIMLVEYGTRAPNVIGEDTNDDDIFDYGYYVTGHKIGCLACHDATLAHIDHVPRTYASWIDNYQSGYRLKSVDGGEPMNVPRAASDPISNWQDFALCLSCHDRDEVLAEIPSDLSVPHTNFWNDDDLDRNSHYVHLRAASLHYDSDFNGTADSAGSCIACHNVHGSPTPAMIRHGELIGAVPALDFLYYKAVPPATATWTSPTLVGGGDYNVYAIWTSNDYRAQDVTYTVYYDGAGSPATSGPLDQRSNGGVWNSLGTFHYDASSFGSVMIDNSFTQGKWVIADAVRWEKVGGGDDLIVDNPAAVYTPSDWLVSTGFPTQRYGDDFQYHGALDAVLDPTATLIDSVGGKMRMENLISENGVCEACHFAISYFRTPFLDPKVLNPQAAPNSAPNDGTGSSLLTVSVLDPYDSATVTIDLSPIGGSASQQMYDDGTNGDVTAGDGIYSYQTDVGMGTTDGIKALDIMATNLSGTDEGVLGLQVLDPNAIYIDNPGATFVCSWSTSTAFPEQRWGDDVRYIAAGGTGSCTASWVPDIPVGQGGTYDVYANWTSNAFRATSVPYMISYNGGTHTEWVDQTQDGGSWYHLGAFDFAEGTSGSVMVSDDATGGPWVVADAIKLKKQ
jgi:hypothetical protein